MFSELLNIDWYLFLKHIGPYDIYNLYTVLNNSALKIYTFHNIRATAPNTVR